MKNIENTLKKLSIADLGNFSEFPNIEFVESPNFEIVEKDEISKIHDEILKRSSELEISKIILLKEKEVLKWLFKDLSFLSIPEDSKQKVAKKAEALKHSEDEWGRKMTKKKRPDLRLDKQWTNVFGQYICEELFLLLGKNPKKPEKKENKEPDLETDEYIIEVKTCTYYTNGTANEKILGVPFKYADVPELYDKPLQIYCLGGAEFSSKEQYGNLPGEKMSEKKKKYIEFFKEMRIEFIGITDMIVKFFTI